ncbi:MAG TPA: GtrA family protein [Gammaproteobacteria bacterium]|nr:GtrA family protein [Gammaproteobacteria bacterium]
MHIRTEFARFIVVGIINTVWGYALYLFFLLFLPYLYAYSIAYILGVITSYFLNSRFVFKVKFSWKKLAKFPIVYVVQYLLGLLIMFIVVEKFGLDKSLSLFVVIIFSVPITFILSRFIIKK